MGVPIVPMIDILTILLIFFIVHTQWKKPQTLLKIDVPGAEFIEGAPSTEQRAVLAAMGAPLTDTTCGNASPRYGLRRLG